MGYFLVFSTIQGNFVALEFLSKIRPRRRCNFYTFFPLLLIITVHFFKFICALSKKDTIEIHLPNDGQPMTIINVKICAIKPRKKYILVFGCCRPMRWLHSGHVIRCQLGWLLWMSGKFLATILWNASVLIYLCYEGGGIFDVILD